jgi:hypothetical protein
MSRANLLIVVVLILALVGMFFWTLTLHKQQADMRRFGANSPSRGTGDPALGGRIEEIEREFDGIEELVRSQIADLGSLERKVDALEATAGEQGARIAALAGETVSPAAMPSAVEEPKLEAAIETVLNQRAERERLERTKRMAEGFTRFLLSDVEATEDQKSRFVTVLTEYLGARDQVRERFSGDTADDQARDAEIAILEQRRNDQILSLFGAASYQKIEERLNRARQGMDNRGGPRGNRGGNPPR